MIKGIIFDFDGTLVDSNQIHVDAFIYAMRKHEISLGSNEILEMFGIPGEEILKKLTPLAPDTIREIMEDKRAFCRRMIAKNGFPEESREIIEKLKKMGYRIAIVSGSHEKFIREVVPDDLVDILYTSDSGLKPKPSADMLLAAAKDMGLPAEECAYVGDASNDMKAAVNAKMGFIAVKSSLTWEFLSKLNPPIVIDDPHEILHIFDEYPKSL